VGWVAGAYMPLRGWGRCPPLSSLVTSLHTECFSATLSTRILQPCTQAAYDGRAASYPVLGRKP
jgi:hypothetical protein